MGSPCSEPPGPNFFSTASRLAKKLLMELSFSRACVAVSSVYVIGFSQLARVNMMRSVPGVKSSRAFLFRTIAQWCRAVSALGM